MSDDFEAPEGLSSDAIESLRIANQKVPFTWMDAVSILFLFGGVGQCIYVGGNQKFCQQRRAPGEPALMFPERKYYMTGMTNQQIDLVPYKMYKNVACERYDIAQALYGGPGGQMIALMMAMSPLGQMAPCGMMELCRMTLMQRCYYYDQVEFALIVYKAIMSFSCGCFVLVLILLIVARKKKFRLYTALLGAFGALLASMAIGWWEMISDEMLMSLGSSAPFPYALHEGCGYNMILGGLASMCFGCYCGCCGVLPEKQPDSESEDDPMAGIAGMGPPGDF